MRRFLPTSLLALALLFHGAAGYAQGMLLLAAGGSGGGPTPHLGFVATRSAVANALITTNKQFNSVTVHTMRDNVAAFEIEFPNWFVNSSFVEAGPGSAATITATYEFPSGTCNRLTFSSSATGTISNAGNILTDPATVNIPPKGSQFKIHTFFNNASGLPVLFDASGPANFLANNFTGDVINAAASGLTDLTNCGTVTENASGSAAYRPVAIIGMTTLPTVLMIGDNSGLHVRRQVIQHVLHQDGKQIDRTIAGSGYDQCAVLVEIV
jgi:hypothetical protein